MKQFGSSPVAFTPRTIIRPTLIGFAALLSSCNSASTGAESSCGGPIQLAAMEDAMFRTVSVRSELVRSMLNSEPDVRHRELSAEVVRLRTDLDRMAEAQGIIDNGGWCDADCESRRETFDIASADLRQRLLEAEQVRDSRASELRQVASDTLESSVLYRFGSVQTLGDGGVNATITCATTVVATLPNGEQVERQLVYTPSSGGRFVEILSVH